MIEIRDLSFTFPGSHTPTLKTLNFELHEGEICIVMGPSGCGKSTLLRILMGLEKNASGTILINNESFGFSDWSDRQTTFSLVPQTPMLLPWKTVRQNVLLATDPKLPTNDRTRQVDALLKVVGLQDVGGEYPWEISVGMASRVSFARTLMMDSLAILFDEPFAALDSETRSSLQIWIADHLRRSGKAGLFVTHDLEEAGRLGSQILKL